MLRILHRILLIALFATFSLSFAFADEDPHTNDDFIYDLDGFRLNRDLWREQLAPGVQKVKLWETNLPFPNIGYLGRGYDIIYGNTLETAVGGDKGYRQPIFRIDSSNEVMPVDWRWLWPKKVDVISKVACDTSLSTKTASNARTIADIVDTTSSETVDTSSDIDAEYVQVKHSYAHTMSDSFKEITGKTKGGSQSVVTQSATCSVYEATLNPFDWPELDPAFKIAIDSLPGIYDTTTQDQYFQFIQTYGTHVVTKILLGARYGKFLVIDTDTLENIEEQEKTKSEQREYTAYVRAAYEGVGVGVGFNGAKGIEESASDAKNRALSNSASEEYSFSLGANFQTDIKEWARSAATDPMPIANTIMPLAEFITNHLDKVKGANMLRAYMDYTPPGAQPVETTFAKCIITSTENAIFKSYDHRVSIVAKCPSGYSAMGGSFTHLWNFNGDIHVDALATTANKLMEDLKGYHKLRLSIVAVNKFIQEGAAMLKAFTDANAMDHIKKLFGSVTDPKLIKKFLNGELESLEYDKKEFLQGIGNGLAVFGNTPIGDMAVEFVKNHPLMKSILDVGKNLVSEVKQKHTILDAVTLVYDPEAAAEGKPQPVPLNLKTVETHADILLALMQVLSAKQNGQSIQAEDAQTLLNFNDIAKVGGEILGDLTSFLAGYTKQYMTADLKKWAKFTGNKDDVIALFEDDIKKETKKITSSTLYQNVMDAHITNDMSDIHGTTMLGLRNSLTFLFPHGDDSWVCGGGTLGVKGTSKSSMGYCSAYCCSSGAWKMETQIASHQNTIDLNKRTSEMVAGCSAGYSVVSGGILISDYQEGRFVQVVTSRPEGDQGWKCGIEWSEEDHIPYPPSYKCIAKCAATKGNRVPCNTYSQPLVNGHATAQCDNGAEMAMSGGWEVQSKGITYFKRTEFKSIHSVEGARAFRCELGTSHDAITGSCFVRCCDIQTSAIEEEVVKEFSTCAPYWKSSRVNTDNGDLIGPGHSIPQGRTLPFTDLGPSLDSTEQMTIGHVLVSKNGEFFARFHPFKDQLIVYEQLGCHETHTIARMKIFGDVKCSHEQGSVEDKIRSYYKYEFNTFKAELDAEEKSAEESEKFADTSDAVENEFKDQLGSDVPSSAHEMEQHGMSGSGVSAAGVDPTMAAMIKSTMAAARDGSASAKLNQRVSDAHEFAWMRPFLALDLDIDEDWAELQSEHAFRVHFANVGGAFGILNRFFGAVSTRTHLQITKNGVGVFFPGSEEPCSEFEITKDNMALLELNDNGDMTFKDDVGNALHTFQFNHCRLFYRKIGATQAVLQNGEMLFLNTGLISNNKIFSLVFLPGGALAVVRQVKSDIYCKTPSVVWTTAKSPQDASKYITDFQEFTEFNREVKEGWVVRLQEDNNLVMYDDQSNMVWNSESSGMGTGKANLYLTDNGELEIIDAVGVTLWSAREGLIKSCTTLRQKLRVRSHRLGTGSELRPGEGGLVSKSGQYIVYIQMGENGAPNNLELWRTSDEDCKGVRIATIKKNINVLRLDPKGVYADSELFIKLDGGVQLNEITLDDSGHLWAHGGKDHRREVSKSFDDRMEL